VLAYLECLETRVLLTPRRGTLRGQREYAALKDQSGPEKRSKHQFPIELPLRYRFIYGERLGTDGEAHSVSISSTHVEVQPISTAIRIRDPIEMFLYWPALLSGRTPMQLYIAGFVTETAEERFIVSIQRYEFRTRAGS
jgi:hypothetical protein